MELLVEVRIVRIGSGRIGGHVYLLFYKKDYRYYFLIYIMTLRADDDYE